MPQFDPTGALQQSDNCLRPDHEDRCIGTFPLAQDSRNQTMYVVTGSLAAFCARDLPGIVIRKKQKDSSDGFSHVGIAITAYPSEIMEIINMSIRYGGLSAQKPKYIKAAQQTMFDAYPYLRDFFEDANPPFNLTTDYPVLPLETLDAFLFESSGDFFEVVKKRLRPRVKIAPLKAVIDSYNGDVCVRCLKTPIPLAHLQSFVIAQLGIPYEKNLWQLLKSCGSQNKIEDDSSWFCSELVARIYKNHDIFPPSVLANNAIPRHFSCGGQLDYLRGYAHCNKWVKVGPKLRDPGEEPGERPSEESDD
jgi:hypothetical protein